MSLPRVRARRLPNEGLWGRRKVTEVECQLEGETSSTRIVTSKPFDILTPILGWDEAALLVSRSDEAWTGGVGPWVDAYTGGVSPD